MAYDVTWLSILGMAAGLLIMGLGTFVLIARPKAPVNRAFFVLALLSGMSSFLFELRDMAQEAALKHFFMASYYFFFIAFVASLAGFGFLFPRPLGGDRRRALLGGVVAASGVVVLAAYAIDHDWFWTMSQVGGGTFFRPEPFGLAIIGGFALVTAFVLVKLAGDVLHGRSAHERRQAAFFFTGMALGYGSTFSADFARNLFTTPEVLYASVRVDVQLAIWAQVAAMLVFLACIVRLVRARASLPLGTRRFFLAGLAGVILLAGTSLASPTAFIVSQIFALVLLPLLLSFAIVSGEAFDVNEQLLRATSLTAASAVLATGFILAEEFIEGILQDGVLGFVVGPEVVQVPSALLAAVVGLVALGGIRRLISALFPGLIASAIHTKNLATYRLVIEGAAEDGTIGDRESRALAALRDSLSITTKEHERILAEVLAAAAERAHEDPRGIKAR